jgi:hypothetical protein
MFYGCNVSCNQLPTSSNGDWSALIQRFSPYSYFIIYKRKKEGRFLPDFRSRLEVGVSSPKMMKHSPTVQAVVTWNEKDFKKLACEYYLPDRIV